MIDIEKVRKIIDNRTKIGTMSRDYGHHVDDILHIENSYELTVIDNAIEELETLRKKETPMKVILHNGKHNGFCPNCGYKELPITIWLDKKTDEIKEIENHFKYCPNCGQRLDWGDKSE